jgi:ACR3 family arsenite transporter
MANLSTKDKQKPFILIGAVIVGILIQRLIGKQIPALIELTQIGVFFVILSVMLPVEIKDVGRAFSKFKPTAIAIFVNFIFIPAFAWAMGWLFLKKFPDFWVGAILYTLTPCIGWYLIFTDLAKGDVAWGIALLPWNIILQIVLMPLYMYILIGRVIPIDFAVLARSVGLFLIGPFVLGYVIQKIAIKAKGRDYFFGPFKKANGEFKLWALVLVILSMFVSQPSLTLSNAGTVGLLILFLILFFVVLFLLALLSGRLFGLTYEDTATMSFTTTARNSEAIIGVAVAAFPGHPLVYLAILLGPIVELPMLLFLSRVLLAAKGRFWQSPISKLKMEQGRRES